MSDRRYKLAGVCGWPVHHSLSPQMHNFWLRKMKLEGAYVPFAVRPDEAAYAFSTLPKTSIVGVNVTMPLKKIALQAAHKVTGEAKRLGAANCLVVREGKLYAHNTDVEGFAAPLLEKFGARQITRSSALVFGNGGAAAAVIEALQRLNCPEIRICGRNNSGAEAMARQINLPSVSNVSWDLRSAALVNAGLIVNATSGGMAGKPPLDIKLSGARPGTFIYDLVYNPMVTPLLAQAAQLGLPAMGGLDMLIAQARPSFRLFYGKLPPADLDPSPVLIRALNESRNPPTEQTPPPPRIMAAS